VTRRALAFAAAVLLGATVAAGCVPTRCADRCQPPTKPCVTEWETCR